MIDSIKRIEHRKRVLKHRLNFAAEGNSGFAVLMAFKLDEVHTSHSDLFGNASVTGGGGFFLRRRTNADYLVSVDSMSFDTLSGAATGETAVIAANYNASTGLFEFYNSTDDAI